MEEELREREGGTSLNDQFYSLPKCLLEVLGYSDHILQYWVESWEM